MDTSIFNDINWLAVIVAALVYFAIGALWYSKALFANKWLAYTKIDPNDPNAAKGAGMIFLCSFIWMVITVIGLAVLRAYLDKEGWMSGLKIGLLTGICFGASAISVSYLYEKRPMGLHLINNGYTLVGHIVAAIIICSWV